jgi:DNA-binding transcriptional MerR regulator
VLRSWEKEFPGIGVQRSADSPRLYRQSDLDQVLRIKQLVFGEGLTLAGARRRMEETSSQRPDADDVEMAEVMETLGADARARIAMVRRGLRSLLDVLSGVPGATAATEFLPGLARETGPPPRQRVAPPATGAGRGGGGFKATAPKTKVAAKRDGASTMTGAKRKRASV